MQPRLEPPDPFALGTDVPQVFRAPPLLREGGPVGDEAERRALAELARVTRYVYSRPRGSR